MIEQTWSPGGAFQLRPTLRFVIPAPSPAAQIRENEARYVVDTIEGPAVVAVVSRDGKVTAHGWGPGAEAAVATVPRLLGFDDDPDAFEPGSGPLRDLHLRYRGLRLGSTARVFDTLLPAVIGQRVTTDEAERSYRRLCRALGETVFEDDDLVLAPRPGVMARLAYDDLHGFGIERGRAETIIEVARRARRLEETTTMDAPAARKRLGAVRGIGSWTVAQVMGAAWGDRDAIPLGDFHLPNTVSWLLAGEPRGDDERMEELLEPYRPYRRRALLLIKLSGVHAPRYGPRSPRSAISG